MAVKEIKDYGWWIPAGAVDPGETFTQAAIRETKEEAGIDIVLKGILRVEHKMKHHHMTARMRVVYYAEPLDPSQPPKSKPDRESDFGLWVTIDEMIELGKSPPGLRGKELIEWATYIERGGVISPLYTFTAEESPVHTPTAPKTNLIVNRENWTALHLAIKAEDEKTVAELLNNSVSLSAVTIKGRNVLHFAIKGKRNILEVLIDKIKDSPERTTLINTKDIKGNTPLHIAATLGMADILNLLIEMGGDLSIRNNKGKAPKELLMIEDLKVSG